MRNVTLKFVKVHDDAILPKANNNKPNIGDTGYDIYSVVDTIVPARGSVVVDVGLKVAFITPGYWMRVEARSGLGFKHGIIPHFGIFDNSYTGPAGIKLYNLTDKDYEVKKGDRIAQFVVYELIQPDVQWADEVQQTDRGDKGFGSSGR